MAERAVSFHPSKKGDVSVNAHTRASSLPLLCWASERSATTLRVGDRGVSQSGLKWEPWRLRSTLGCVF